MKLPISFQGLKIGHFMFQKRKVFKYRFYWFRNMFLGGEKSAFLNANFSKTCFLGVNSYWVSWPQKGLPKPPFKLEQYSQYASISSWGLPWRLRSRMCICRIFCNSFHSKLLFDSIKVPKAGNRQRPSRLRNYGNKNIKE